MAGKIINVISQRFLSQSSMAGTNGYMEAILAQGIDVSEWTEVTLVVRLLDKTITSTSSVEIFAQSEGRTSDDPSVQFVSSTKLGSVTMTSSTVTPQCFLRSLGPNLGSAIRIMARNTFEDDASAEALVNIDLTLKSS